MYLHDDHYHTSECYQCSELKDDIIEIKYWFKYLLEQLYSTSPLDKAEFERTLEEAGACLGLNIPTSDLAIERKQYPKPNQHPLARPSFDIESWKLWNNKQLKQLVTQK